MKSILNSVAFFLTYVYHMCIIAGHYSSYTRPDQYILCMFSCAGCRVDRPESLPLGQKPAEGCKCEHTSFTVFHRRDAAATIYFSATAMRHLFEGGAYSRGGGALIRWRRLFEGGTYSRVALIRGGEVR